MPSYDLFQIQVVHMENEVEIVNDNSEPSTSGGEDQQETNVSDAQDTIENLIPLKRTRKYASPVWDYAVRIRDGVVKCNLCEVEVQCPDSNTTNIRSHILSVHAGTEEAIALGKNIEEKGLAAKKKKEEKNKKEIDLARGQAAAKTFFKPVSIPKKDSQAINEAIVDFIICDNKSFDTVSSYHFRKMLFKANSGYVMPGRKSMTNKIDERIKEVRDKLS